MQEKVDKEVQNIIETSYKEAISLVKENRKILDKVSEKLLETETLEKSEFEKIVGKKPEK